MVKSGRFGFYFKTSANIFLAKRHQQYITNDSLSLSLFFSILIHYSFEIIGLCSAYHTTDYGSVRVQNSHFHFPWPRIPNGVTQITFTVTNVNNAVFIILSPSTDINDTESIPKIGKCQTGNIIIVLHRLISIKI